MVAHIELTDGIEQSVDDLRIRALYLQWKEATKYDGLPKATAFMPELSPYANNLMVLKRSAEGFQYLYDGSDNAAKTGFRMTGKTTNEFDSEIGDFFAEKFDQALKNAQPIYTVHHGHLIQSVVSWERIILPLREENGGEIIVCFNKALDQKTILFDRLLESSMDGIIILTPKLTSNREIEDFQYSVVNPAAQEFMKRTKEDLLGKGMLETFPNGRNTAFETYKRVWETGTSERVELDYRFEELGIFLLVSAVKAADRIVVSLSDRTSLKEAQERMELQNADLAFSNDSLQEQA